MSHAEAMIQTHFNTLKRHVMYLQNFQNEYFFVYRRLYDGNFQKNTRQLTGLDVDSKNRSCRHVFLFSTLLFFPQIELENLNSCTDDINKLEIELEVRMSVFCFKSAFRVLSRQNKIDNPTQIFLSILPSHLLRKPMPLSAFF